MLYGTILFVVCRRTLNTEVLANGINVLIWTVCRWIAILQSMDKAFEGEGGNVEGARKVGEMIAKRAVEKNITDVVFDRGGYLYHGRVKELAEGARENGLKF